MATLTNVTIAEVTGQDEEDQAWLDGASIVVRLDLLPGYVAPVDPPDEEEPPTDPVDPPANTGLIEFTTLPAVIPDAPANQLGSGDFELTLDFKLNHALSGHTFMLSKGVAGSLNSAWYLAVLSGGWLTFTAANNGAQIYVPYPHISDYTNKHAVKLKRVSGVTTLYVDDVVMSSTDAVIYSGAGDLYIGQWNYTTANCQVHDVSNVRLVK